MSHSPFLYCACWDPWNVRGKRLIKTISPMELSMVNSIKLKASYPPGVQNKLVALLIRSFKSHHKETYLEHEVLSFEFIEISPGYTLTRSKEHLSVTLGEEFFERKTAEEPGSVKVPLEDVITDLEEQIAELTDMMEQLRRDHQASRKLVSPLSCHLSLLFRKCSLKSVSEEDYRERTD
uniref:Uncharacterized protein n=1 Tax=Gopherus agassizii TaxID=38772 RepID=A0A452J2R6_9SAUR